MECRYQSEGIHNKLIRFGAKGYPSSATIELTKRCNASCDYCYVLDNTATELLTDDLKKTIDKISESGIFALTLTGGEPFLRLDIKEILEHIFTKDFWYLSIFTNATLINDDMLEFLKQNSSEITEIQISIFSSVPEKHDNYIGVKNGFSKAIGVAKELTKVGIIVRFAFNILDFNFEEQEEFLEIARKINCHVVLGYHKAFNKSKSGLSQNFSRLSESVSKKNIEYAVDNMPTSAFDIAKKKFLNRGLGMAKEYRPCTGIYTGVTVLHNGDLTPCILMPNVKIGHIFDNGLIPQILDRSEKLKKVHKITRADIQPCSNCEHVSYCGICIGISGMESGDMLVMGEQFCNYTKALYRRAEKS